MSKREVRGRRCRHVHTNRAGKLLGVDRAGTHARVHWDGNAKNTVNVVRRSYIQIKRASGAWVAMVEDRKEHSDA